MAKIAKTVKTSMRLTAERRRLMPIIHSSADLLKDSPEIHNSFLTSEKIHN
jgi:hypothetical protein